MADFASKLAERMVALNLTQSALARLSGVPQTTISNYLSRSISPSWVVVQTLARALEVSCSDLTDDDLPPPPPPAEVRPPGRPPKATPPLAAPKPRPPVKPRPAVKQPREVKQPAEVKQPKARRKGEDA